MEARGEVAVVYHVVFCHCSFVIERETATTCSRDGSGRICGGAIVKYGQRVI